MNIEQKAFTYSNQYDLDLDDAVAIIAKTDGLVLVQEVQKIIIEDSMTWSQIGRTYLPALRGIVDNLKSNENSAIKIIASSLIMDIVENAWDLDTTWAGKGDQADSYTGVSLETEYIDPVIDAYDRQLKTDDIEVLRVVRGWDELMAFDLKEPVSDAGNPLVISAPKFIGRTQKHTLAERVTEEYTREDKYKGEKTVHGFEIINGEWVHTNNTVRFLGHQDPFTEEEMPEIIKANIDSYVELEDDDDFDFDIDQQDEVPSWATVQHIRNTHAMPQDFIHLHPIELSDWVSFAWQTRSELMSKRIWKWKEPMVKAMIEKGCEQHYLFAVLTKMQYNKEGELKITDEEISNLIGNCGSVKTGTIPFVEVFGDYILDELEGGDLATGNYYSSRTSPSDYAINQYCKSSEEAVLAQFDESPDVPAQQSRLWNEEFLKAMLDYEEKPSAVAWEKWWNWQYELYPEAGLARDVAIEGGMAIAEANKVFYNAKPIRHEIVGIDRGALIINLYGKEQVCFPKFVDRLKGKLFVRKDAPVDFKLKLRDWLLAPHWAKDKSKINPWTNDELRALAE